MPSLTRSQRTALRSSPLHKRHLILRPQSQQNGTSNTVLTPPCQTLVDVPAGVTLRRRYKPELIDVYLSTIPVQVICRRVPWSALIHFAGTRTITQYLAQRLERTTCLLVQAYQRKATKILPNSIRENFVTLCCAERALRVFGLDEELDHLRNYMEKHYLSTQISVNKLRPVWDCMPRGTYWSDRILDCIQEGLAYMDDYVHQHGQCYCRSSQPCYTTHKNCLGAWLVSDNLMLDALGKYRNSRGPSLHTRFDDEDSLSMSRTSKWVLSVKNEEDVKLNGRIQIKGTSPGNVNRRVPVETRPSLRTSSYCLEWIDEDGGYYLETSGYSNGPQSDLIATETTAVSREWLASRGHRGGGPSSGGDEEGSIGQRGYHRAQVLPNAGIEVTTHHCPDWLRDEDHLVCAFREEPLYQPRPKPHRLMVLYRAQPGSFPLQDGLCKCKGHLVLCKRHAPWV
ncbi:hypothetical protein T440DRAFT_539387 [Plenodomus tracheiphilus IPT5]|uniref:Uncharacterized protein n=1 Tax=Plenodomus tracheiphilus IPT5 TaxID=1408161 RepID=A0A6A7BID0_9PLEO|nr:hypothetical protein T440DRAFT_539387 [Plenodomus tracheiphilus IPT5]